MHYTAGRFLSLRGSGADAPNFSALYEHVLQGEHLRLALVHRIPPFAYDRNFLFYPKRTAILHLPRAPKVILSCAIAIVIGQAFLDCDFGVVFGEQGLDKKAEAGAHRPGT